jgi:sigma-B regulation protein RsbU (phosphoserine phosphatase)
MPRGIVVGAIDAFAFEGSRLRLAPGDAIVAFSDGVTEARSPTGDLFGEARLRSVLEDARSVSALARVEAIQAAVRAFTEGGRPADDLTLLVIGRPPGERPHVDPSEAA